MFPSMKSLGIDQLSVPERILLVEEIWDSIAATPEDLPLTDAQRVELDRRLAACETDPTAGTDWEEVKIRLKSLGRVGPGPIRPLYAPGIAPGKTWA
jgi:putative addiction module component (TIGR02574 family)